MAPKRTLIKNVRVFDGTKLLSTLADVLIQDELIAEISPTTDNISDAVNLNADIIDGSGKTLLPGLLDAHTHTRAPWGEQSLVWGVTTEMDLMSFPEDMLPLRAEAAERMSISDIKSSSISMTVPGGWPTPLIQEGVIRDFPQICSLDDVEPFIQNSVENEQADVVKLLVDTRKWHQPIPTMGMDMVEKIVQMAHKYDRLAICHIHEQQAAIDVVKAGVDGLAHLFLDEPPSEKFVKLAAEKGIFIVTTFGILAGLSNICLSGEFAQLAQVEKYTSALGLGALCRDASGWGYRKADCKNPQWAFDAARALHKAGVPLLVGSDSLRDMSPCVCQGVSVHHEMWLLVDECGFTPLEALRSATGRTAEAYGWKDRGIVGAGKLADLVLVDGDPTEDIRKSLDISAVWRRGQMLDREAARLRIKKPDWGEGVQSSDADMKCCQ
jgi:imidazolonepropionase-like amidohydrolase